MNTTNTDYLTSERLNEVLLVIRLVCAKILTPCFCFAGFFANILNVVVLTRAWMGSSTNVYLTAVAVCDLFYLLCSFLFSLYVYDTMRQKAFFMYSVPFIRGTANLFSNTTTWLTVCFTLERCIAVSSPILGRRFCTQQRAKYVVAITCAVSFVITFPDYVKSEIIPVRDNSSRKFTVDESAYGKFFAAFGYDYINQIVFVFLPMILLIIFNSILVRSVLKANKGRRGLVSHGSGTRRGLTENPTYLRERSQTTEASVPSPVVKDALEASMKTTVELTSTISQSYIKSAKESNTPTSAVQQRRPILGEQQKITIMLITIVMAFVILQLPSTVPLIVENLGNAGILLQTDLRRKYMLLYSNISNVLLIINAAMNFVFYSLFSAKFRQTCCILLRRCKLCIVRTTSDTEGPCSCFNSLACYTPAPLRKRTSLTPYFSVTTANGDQAQMSVDDCDS